jgi:NTE family protein
MSPSDHLSSDEAREHHKSGTDFLTDLQNPVRTADRNEDEEQDPDDMPRPGSGEEPPGTEPGVALCLSGGGYRAMLFHIGAIWRLNELGYLPLIDRVSSVSGGSIAAAALGLRWSRLSFDDSGVAGNLVEEVVEAVRALAARTIDKSSLTPGFVTRGRNGRSVIRGFDRHLFGGATLQDLPDKPRVVVVATNLQSGVLWRFSKPYISDYRVGTIINPSTSLAVAVTASVARLPLVVSLKFEDSAYAPGSGIDLQRPPFTTNVALADGGITDSLALETAWKRYRNLLVSDGGVPTGATPHPDASRLLSLAEAQVHSVRRYQTISSFTAGHRGGAYWGVGSDIHGYGVEDVLQCPPESTARLASIPTSLAALDGNLQKRLVNWGFAVCDAAIRGHVDSSVHPPNDFPYPNEGV